MRDGCASKGLWTPERQRVALPTMRPQYEIKRSPRSIAGQRYFSANEDLIASLREQELDVATEGWKEGGV